MASRLRIIPCDAGRAGEIHALTRAAFAAYDRLDPPSGALRETAQRVAADLAAGGGAIAERDGRAVGCLRWQADEDCDLHVRRVAVLPELRRQGIGAALMAWAEQEAVRRGANGVTVGVRVALPRNLAFYRALGYEVLGERRHDGYDHTTWLALRKPLRPGRPA
jgi:ribosomal protein S18 acetylase RimI-like enzyme